MKVRLLVEFDPATKRWSAVFPELPGCASAGDTGEEAIANAKEALCLWFEPASRMGDLDTSGSGSCGGGLDGRAGVR
jgi:predicted RNase H-like HicB family nuclease